MNLLSVENLSKRYGPRLLFEGFSFGMAQGEKVAIVAPNGSGKTTLLRAIAGVEPADSGEITFRAGTRVGYLPQEPEFPEGFTLTDAIIASEHPMNRAIIAYEKALRHPEDEKGPQQAMDETDRPQAWPMATY
jgi:ATP-binding cassette subfamily F protein uup